MSKPPRLYVVRLSAPCRAVLLFCAHHQLPMEIVDVDLAGPEDSGDAESKKGPFWTQNPNRSVPFYEESDSFVLWEVGTGGDSILSMVKHLVHGRAGAHHSAVPCSQDEFPAVPSQPARALGGQRGAGLAGRVAATGPHARRISAGVGNVRV
jgi:hypothetical protein